MLRVDESTTSFTQVNQLFFKQNVLLTTSCHHLRRYDFKIRDGLSYFVQDTHGKEVTCYIEVKSSIGKFDGTFHVSDNELRTCQKMAGSLNCAYVLAFVECAGTKDTRFVHCLVWSADLKAVHLEPQE
jgi:hypothetical protein